MLFISGMVKVPVVTTLATAEPETVPIRQVEAEADRKQADRQLQRIAEHAPGCLRSHSRMVV